MSDHNKTPLTIGSIVQLTESGVHQDIDVLGRVTRRFVDVTAAQLDGAIRAKLIELGWIPPEWQPIDTAPRDGTVLLLAQRDPDYPLLGDEGAWYQFTGSFKHGEWYCEEYDAIEKAPTHWKPLGPDPTP